MDLSMKELCNALDDQVRILEESINMRTIEVHRYNIDPMTFTCSIIH